MKIEERRQRGNNNDATRAYLASKGKSRTLKKDYLKRKYRICAAFSSINWKNIDKFHLACLFTSTDRTPSGRLETERNVDAQLDSSPVLRAFTFSHGSIHSL